MRHRADLMFEDVPRPPVRGRLTGVPAPELVVIEPVEEDGDVPPGQLCNSLLQNLLVRPRCRERPHIREVPRGEPLHLRELGPQIRCEPADDVAPPPFLPLALQNRCSDSPVETDQFRVHAALRREPSSTYLLL